MATTPLPARAPGPEWGTFTSTHFKKELARRNMGAFTESNLNTSGLNSDLKARVAALEAKARLQARGVIPPSTEAALGKGGVGPRTSTPNPAQPATAPRPTSNTPGTRPGIGVGGGIGAGVAAQFAYPLLNKPVSAVGRALGNLIGETTGIKDSDEEWAAKPGWFKRWTCYNSALGSVLGDAPNPRCEEAPPPQSGSEVAGDSLVSYGQPPFTGGQGVGIGYRVFYRFNSKTPGGTLIEPPREENVAFPPNGCIGPIRKMEAVGPFGAQQLILFHGPGLQTVVSNSTATQGSWFNLKITSVVRLDGQPDTAGNPQGDLITLPAERPQRSTPPAPSTPDFNPAPLPPTAPATPATPPAAPAPTPELEPTNPAPNRPPDRKVAPIPTPTPQQAIAPDGSPTGNPAPDATPTNVPQGGTATLPSGTTVTKTGTGYEISVPLGDARPLVSPRPVETPDGETINPGETITEEKKAGGLPWWLAAPPVVAKIPQGTKVNATDPSTFADPELPKTPPPPQAPTDNPCRCNAPINNRLDKLDEKLTKALGGVSAAGDAGILTYLMQMQAFAAKAWEMSRIQKVLNALTLITVLHNASMVSRDVGETMGYALSQGLDVLGIEDEEGNALDVNGWFGTQANNFFENLFGAERWHGLNETWNKANRIISSATMIVWTLRSIHDGTQEVLEWTAENTGKIGNALRRWGVVGKRAYGPMAERVKAQDAYRRKVSRFFDGAETIENVASSFATITGEVVNLQDEVGQLGEQRENFTNAVRDMVPGAYPDNSDIPTTEEAAKTNATAGPAVTATDMEPGTNGTP